MAPSQPSELDPFDSLLTLEDTLYTDAYQLGVKDGSRAGRIEGRVFGLEKGFEKFAALGQLHGRAAVWGSRLPVSTPAVPRLSPIQLDISSSTTSVGETESKGNSALPTLRTNERLMRHIHTLHALTDPPTFSTLNTEDAVADYDDRHKRAGAKVKLIERIVNEFPNPAADQSPASPDEVGREGPASPPKRSGVRVAGKAGEVKKKRDDGFEDFEGSRFLN
ncbi:hypothetical protein P280DRAFT_163472 [Massarina eburnea CBS 473.64]|uniref:Essential protein Yae1 N-terminal domain-containing protein n=1 Tax=Massarina eburnea CBS 473.64 TaxID=1395130 RepID=A0A6A6RN94_9PLEO|nr:hypothetical protein P280DRAFT_163472 [Massarina eburnea CBS 473.64]